MSYSSSFKYLLLLGLLPACVKDVPGYCDEFKPCGENQYCDKTAFACRDGDQPCDINNDCPDDKLCAPESKTCQFGERACAVDDDCPAARFCSTPPGIMAGTCAIGDRAPGCRNDADCRPGQLCVAPGTRSCADAIAAGIFTGAQAVPPNPSTNEGLILFYLKNNTELVYSLRHSVPAPTAVRVHSGTLGVVGAPVASIPELLKGNEVLGTIKDFPSDQVTELTKGNLYVSIPTSTFPGGELRAQVFPMIQGLTAGPLDYVAILSPLQTPLVRSTTAFGRGNVTIDEPAGAINYNITINNLNFGTNPLSGVHIHRGAFNTEGKHIADVAPPPTASPAMGKLLKSDFAQVYPEQAPFWNIAIKSGAAYFNIHSTNFSDGEIRGQLLPFTPGTPIAVALPFNVKLSAAPGVTTASTGFAQFFLNQAQSTLTWRLSHTAVGVTSVRIEKAGIIVCEMGSGADKSMGTCPAVKTTGTVNTDLLLSDLKSTGGVLNVILRTSTNPNGELRGAILLPTIP